MTTLNIEDSTEAESAAAPKRGYTRRGARTEASREAGREPARQGAVVVEGRNGEILTRHRTGVKDPYEIPPHLIPPNYRYQWNAISVVGNKDMVMDQSMTMFENGWRPVPAERHPGVFVPHGTKGEIIRGGQRLEERPTALCEEAAAEDRNTARQLMHDRNESVKRITDGTAFGPRRDSHINMNIGRGVFADESGNIREAPRPSHQFAEPGE
jgi:hypothetical protein